MGDYSDAMTSAVAALRNQLAEARLSVGTSSASFDLQDDVTSPLQDQYNGQLNQAQRWIDKLDGELRAQVDAGTLPISNWQAIAAQQQSAIATTTQANTNDLPSLSKFFDQVVVQSAKDLGSAAKPFVPDPGNVKWYLVAALAGLLLIAIIKVE